MLRPVDTRRIMADVNAGRLKGVCVPVALAAIIGEDPTVLLQRARERDPIACTRRKPGTKTYAMEHVLRAYGHTLTWQHMILDPIPIHRALARLHGRRAILLTRSRYGAHVIAAEGFLVSDTAYPSPVWFGDYLVQYRMRVIAILYVD